MRNAMPPLGLAMVVCEAVHVDSLTGRRNLLGAFSKLTLPDFPWRLESLAVHFAMTECLGDYELVFRCGDLNFPGQVIHQRLLRISSPSPLEIKEVDVALKDVIIHKPCQYYFELLMDGSPIMARKLTFELR